MATNSKIRKSLEAKGWSFKSFISGRGKQAEKGQRKLTGTSWTDLFHKIRGY